MLRRHTIPGSSIPAHRLPALHRRSPLRTLSVLLSLCLSSLPLLAQMHHVSKPEQVTRAIGVYEWTGDLTRPDASRLIPVSLFINGHFEDAGVYLARPVPLTLETGTVYSIQRSGDQIGTLDLDYARDVVDKRSADDDNPLGAWYGYGRFLPLTVEPTPKLKPSTQLSAIASSSSKDDGQPHFTNRSPADTSTPAGTSTPSSTSSPASSDDPDRPHMSRRSDSDSSTGNAPISPGTNSSGTATNTTGTVPDDDPDRPTLRHRDPPPDQKQKKSKNDGGFVEPMRTSLNDDPDRPAIHRGKVASATAPPALAGLPPNLHQAIAVSDATDRPAHVFAREWESPTERAGALDAMQKLAQPLVQQYLATNHLKPAAATATPSGPKLVTTSAKSPTTAASHATTHRSAAAPTPAPLQFTGEQIAGFTLSYGGLPTFVYTAALPTTGVPGEHSPSGGVATAGPSVRVTIVAQRLPSGDLQTALTSVTDDAHLDRTPWMRLVDAVDSDASHRASLLFELRAQSSRQFALYSLASAQAQQTFVTGVIE